MKTKLIHLDHCGRDARAESAHCDRGGDRFCENGWIMRGELMESVHRYGKRPVRPVPQEHRRR